MPTIKRTRSTTQDTEDNTTPTSTPTPTVTATSTPINLRTPRRQATPNTPSTQNVITNPDHSPRPILTRSATIHLSTRSAQFTHTRRNSLLHLPGPSRQGGNGGTLTRTQSTPTIVNPASLKSALTPGGSGGRGKGDPDGSPSGGGSNGRRFGKGKENIPPKKVEDENSQSQGSRKRLRVGSVSGSVVGRGRSGSVNSVRSESTSGRASLGPSSSFTRSSRLLSPSPSPSSAPSNSLNSFDSFRSTDDVFFDKTPTKSQKHSVVAMLPTPPPSSPALSQEVQLTASRLELVRMQSTPSVSPVTPVTPESEREDVFMEDATKKNPYKALKTLLRLSAGQDASLERVVIGRDEEKAIIKSYITNQETKAMYISGPPGTGKTATVTAMARELRETGWKVFELGCMGVKVADMWRRLGEELECDKTEEGVREHLDQSSNTLLVLDEIDSLLPPAPALPPPATSHLLTKLFSLPSSTTKLIAISNTLDLTLRASLLLPQGSEPLVLPFKAYSATDMSAIVHSRLSQVGENGVQADGKAIELLTRKVEAQNGDLRMCLGCLTSAVTQAESDWLKKCSTAPTADDVPLVKIGLSHIVRAFNQHTQQLRAAAGSSAGVTSQVGRKIRSVQLQGKMVLVSLLVFMARARAGLQGIPTPTSTPITINTPITKLETLTVPKLYATYTTLLSHKNSPFPPSAESDFRDLLSNLEVLGLISVPMGNSMSRSGSGPVRGKGGKVELCVREDEVREGLGIGEKGIKGLAEEEVTRIWEREQGRIERVKLRKEGELLSPISD
ncbi:hypothetical protein M231_01811 [Tremella mesenterica]|uniref:AAA+ ATPase domain-containing protein n=1 Tax=Tremella mesenterica TaxID=5217 RepID=A0A4Q1BSF5_TREME|nr:hypothetical protein M231_01811 [Tremella mesenterica]